MKFEMVVELPRIDDDWILRRRGSRLAVDPYRPHAFIVEPEPTREGVVEDVATIFISNKECPFRCLMCDLWKYTTTDRVPSGAVTGQIRLALDRLPPVRHLKLYNAGNFFDGQAISRGDLAEIAALVAGHTTVIVECHPRLVDRRCVEFAGRIGGRLQVAMGLETIDPDVLPRLNKRMTTEDYRRATGFLTGAGVDVRAFILLRAPFQTEAQGVFWAMRSIEWAFDAGVECCVVIPTRAGNGAMDQLRDDGLFSPPSLASLEAVAEYGVSLGRGRVFADLWDAEQLSVDADDPARLERLTTLNLTQRVGSRPIDSAAPGNDRLPDA